MASAQRRHARGGASNDALGAGPVGRPCWTGLLSTGLLSTGLLARNRTFRALISFGTETAGRATTTVATPFGTSHLDCSHADA